MSKKSILKNKIKKILMRKKLIKQNIKKTKKINISSWGYLEPLGTIYSHLELYIATWYYI